MNSLIYDIKISIIRLGFPGGSVVKNLPAKQKARVRSLGGEDPLEKAVATHSSILAWEIPWTEEPGGLWSTGSQRVGHDWATEQQQIIRLLVNAWKSQYVLTKGVTILSLVEICFPPSFFSFLHFHFIFINPNADQNQIVDANISILKSVLKEIELVSF